MNRYRSKMTTVTPSTTKFILAFTCNNKTFFQQNSMDNDLFGYQYDPELVWVLTTDVQYLITNFMGSQSDPVTFLMRD